MTEPDLTFITRQLERVLAELQIIRGDLQLLREEVRLARRDIGRLEDTVAMNILPRLQALETARP